MYELFNQFGYFGTLDINNDIDEDYKFYLRYNSSPIYPTEITLIAV